MVLALIASVLLGVFMRLTPAEELALVEATGVLIGLVGLVAMTGA